MPIYQKALIGKSYLKVALFSLFFVATVSTGFLSMWGIKTFPIISTQLMLDKDLKNQKVAFIIAPRNFQDEEYIVPKRYLDQKGVKVDTVSTKKTTAIGAEGATVEVDITLDELDVSKYNAIIFIGGPGVVGYLDNESSWNIAQESISENKVLGAICIAPTILARAGVLSDKNATVWRSSLDKEGINILEENGANYIEKSVVVDDNIITADGPESSEQFAKRIAQLLKKKN